MATAALTWDEARERVRKLRDEQHRSSEEVLDLWDDALADFCYKLGDEAWLVHEQVFVAALDCCQMQVAEASLDALKTQFPGSLRVKKLIGMKYEACDKFDSALKIYEAIKEEDPMNVLVVKRIIAIFKAQNKIKECIEAMTVYLSQHQSDYEAWLELTDLYLSEQDYSKAAFCLEEVLLSNPHNHLYHQRYAEVKYTQGGAENMELALSYFSHAARLHPENLRALYGVFLSATNLATKNNSKAKKEHLKYASWAADQIQKLYLVSPGADTDQHQMKCLEGMLESTSIS